MRIPFDESNKEEKQKNIDKLVNKAKDDGIDASYAIEENKFVITLPGTPVSLIEKYCKLFDKI